MKKIFGACLLLAMSVSLGCGSQEADTKEVATYSQTLDGNVPPNSDIPASEQANWNESKIEKVQSSCLPNAWRLHPKVISGGLPEGDAAFQELQSLGIKTVISVDGTKPDVELARKFGMRYVHLPHGYDGVPTDRAKALAKAVRDLEGPIYIHCHHGKHRSPTAAAVACIGAGLVDIGSGELFLKKAGTGGNYRGLYESAREALRFDSAELDRLAIEFKEVINISHLAEAMVEIDNHFANLKKLEQLKWDLTTEATSGIEASHEALLLRESYAELIRALDFANEPEGFEEALRRSEMEATQLEDALSEWDEQQTPMPPDSVPEAFTLVANSCNSCHKKYRDVPLSEK